MEALSYGIPVICSNGGSLKEIFENHTLMFDPKDKKQLKTHLLKLIKNEQFKNELSLKGMKYAKNFTWEKTAERTIKAFEL